ncbi:hypothetical protein DFP72DRAFT_197540 [Ephemerocybe angulata]|uniref:Uncharacterized protein n=1 Tax=Ephemerocybe angulata TaxID=980116 RepID=A0A8H6LTK8_9AGAR|nr:hypothetical protein DFP72DRAFT_197540 [Tulosesus angulatus]
MALPMVIRALIGISLQAMPPLAVVSGEEGRPVPAARPSALPQSLSHLQPTHRGARPLCRASLATRACGRLPVFFGRRSCCLVRETTTLTPLPNGAKPHRPPPRLTPSLFRNPHFACLSITRAHHRAVWCNDPPHYDAWPDLHVVSWSYLVCDYESGRLNLNAGHFAQLIALMCFVQITYRFYLYYPYVTLP